MQKNITHYIHYEAYNGIDDALRYYLGSEEECREYFKVQVEYAQNEKIFETNEHLYKIKEIGENHLKYSCVKNEWRYTYDIRKISESNNIKILGSSIINDGTKILDQLTTKLYELLNEVNDFRNEITNKNPQKVLYEKKKRNNNIFTTNN